MNTWHVKTSLLSGILATLAFWSGCATNDSVVNNDQFVGSGRLISQTRTVGTFTGIQVTNIGKVLVTQDTVESLRIEVDDNLVDRVVTSLSGATLVVGLRDGSYSNVTLHVYASMKTINRLESRGAAEFSATNPLQADSIVCKIVGSGTITLSGRTDFQAVEIVGAGDIRNFNLVSTTCYAAISGAGNIDVNVTGQLDAVITGTGTITYAGNPAVLHQVITGIGSVKSKP